MSSEPVSSTRAPDPPFPAALDDAFAAYRDLLTRYEPEAISVSGGSAGGNIAAALILKVRDAGLPLPGALARKPQCGRYLEHDRHEAAALYSFWIAVSWIWPIVSQLWSAQRPLHTFTQWRDRRHLLPK